MRIYYLHVYTYICISISTYLHIYICTYPYIYIYILQIRCSWVPVLLLSLVMFRHGTQFCKQTLGACRIEYESRLWLPTCYQSGLWEYKLSETFCDKVGSGRHEIDSWEENISKTTNKSDSLCLLQRTICYQISAGYVTSRFLPTESVQVC